MFFPDPARGLPNRRVFCARVAVPACAVISSSDRVPMLGILADTLSGYLPSKAAMLQSLVLGWQTAARLIDVSRGRLSCIFGCAKRLASIVDSVMNLWHLSRKGPADAASVLALPESRSRRAIRAEVAHDRLAKFQSKGRLQIERRDVNRGGPALRLAGAESPQPNS